MTTAFKSRISEKDFTTVVAGRDGNWHHVDRVGLEEARASERRIWEHAEAIQIAAAAVRPKERPSGILGGMTADLLAEERIPDREVLLGGAEGTLFFNQSINQLLAHRGVGKTMLGLSIAGALATGGEVLGMKASRPL